MGLFDFLRRPDAGLAAPAPPTSVSPVQAGVGDAVIFSGMDDPRLLEFIRTGGGSGTAAGISVTSKMAMRNTTVLRCVSLISYSVGMLPMHLINKDDRSKATEHPLFRVLHRKPNGWQTAFEFRSLMQQRALQYGDAFARIVRTGNRITALVPIDNTRISVEQRPDWSLEYRYSRPNQDPLLLRQGDVFHLRGGLSDDGFTGLSLVKQAAEAIALAIQTEKASARLFRNGMIVGQVLKHPGKLSAEAYERLKESMIEREGAAQAYRTLILEENMDVGTGGTTGKDAQALEQRSYQVEEISRAFGVPRPLLMMDDTSWGSGIDVLGQFFVRYALNPWFEAWQQAIERDLLTDAEADQLEAKFNAGALLRGSMVDQGEFFAKGLGAGGHAPFLEVDEVRGWLDLGPSDNLPPQMGREGGNNDAPQTA